MLWFLVAILPVDTSVRDRVDVMEINHCYNEAGVHQYDQVIFWDWCNDHNRLQVRAWRLIKPGDNLPERSSERPEYHCVWRDRDIVREVRASLIRETWTCYDPEALDREFLPETKRLGLTLQRPKRPGQDVVQSPPARPQEDAVNTAAP